ncbi:MAG: TonB-dependent receptor [Planctomycetota bacterium]|jgi:hemoglobin/transferrin/lactoferrin receptor protein|nr:TonB-dependent receptor [Planctomycetota bacterium]
MVIEVLLLALQTPQEPTPQKLVEPTQIDEIVVTASAFADDPLDQPFAIDSLNQLWLRTRSRTMAESLAQRPGVMVQKTAPGQSSPYLRGFTGFHTQLLIDGVPLNHAAMRSGPNQYWSTVDNLTIERLELVRGPSSVIYGSDAVGGTVNAVSRRAAIGGNGVEVDFGSFTRWASADNGWTQRLETAIHDGTTWGLLGGVTVSRYGDLSAGSGELPETDYSQGNADLRFDRYWDNDVEWTIAAQTVRQEDVPRTHKTIYAVPFHGTSVGKELRRDLDQTRDLYYSRLRWSDHKGWLSDGEITLSAQRHAEGRDRLRSGDRRDLQGFELWDYGLTARFQSDFTDLGQWSYGVEIHRQNADSYRHNFTAGSYTGSAIQGAFGDNSTYDSAAIYVQDEIAVHEDFSLIPGVRASWFSLQSDRVDNPAAGPAEIQVDESWTALTGGVRGVWYLQGDATAFIGLSQGFRAPNLSDLTSLDATSAVETPSTNLKPEHFLQFEVGTKGASGRWAWQTSAYQTWIEDMIVQSPTGVFIDSVPEVQKSNDGDGWLRGIEFDVHYLLDGGFSLFSYGAWMSGEVDQVALPAGTVSREPMSRLAPLQATGGLRWTRDDQRVWCEGWVWAVDNQDRLALRDITDTSRIPAGGTPGYTILGLTAGMEVNPNATWTVSLENLGDIDYRVHGSGLNGPGLNIITTWDMDF